MATTNLPYVGPTAASNNDLVNNGYVTNLLASALTQVSVTTQINTQLGTYGYAPSSYIQSQAALNATQSYIQSQAALYAPLSQLGVANGLAPLGVSGRIPGANLTLPSTQRFPQPFYSPTSYHSTNQTSLGTATQLFTMSIADPMFNGVANSPYKLMVHGVIDGQISTDGQYPMIRVAQGSPTGQLVGLGAGLGEYYIPGVVTLYSNPGTAIYTIPSFAAALDVVALGGGGGAQASVFFSGTGGGAGQFANTTYTKSTGWPSPTLNINVGAGGVGGTSGGAQPTAGGVSTISGVGFSTVTGTGGVAQGNTFSNFGAAAGSIAYNGQNYVGGAQQSTYGGTGNTPGGGGASGANGGINAGGAGAGGAVWIFAYPSPDVPGGPINVMSTPLNTQTAITGPTTLYIMLTSSALLSAVSGTTAIATTLKPLLQAVPIPA
jgi:hypothetical protein